MSIRHRPGPSDVMTMRQAKRSPIDPNFKTGFFEQYEKFGSLWLDGQIESIENDIRDAFATEFGPFGEIIPMTEGFLRPAVGWNEEKDCLAERNLVRHHKEVRERRESARRRLELRAIAARQTSREEEENRKKRPTHVLPRKPYGTTEFVAPPLGYRHVFVPGTGLVVIPLQMPEGLELPAVTQHVFIRICGAWSDVEVPVMEIALEMKVGGPPSS